MTGRDRRLQAEWDEIRRRFSSRKDIECKPARLNPEGMPTAYLVKYDIRSICGIDASGAPEYADSFLMRIDIPASYPCIDAMPSFRFLVRDDNGEPIAHPWHPNIRYFGDFSGRVCINFCDSFTDIAWGISRVAQYLRYEIYHALNEPPFPEDQQVASWVIRVGEPEGWI